jgi:hypothetical protein
MTQFFYWLIRKGRSEKLNQAYSVINHGVKEMERVVEDNKKLKAIFFSFSSITLKKYNCTLHKQPVNEM